MAQIDTIMITAMQSIEEVAAYNVAYPTAQILLTLVTPLLLVLLPEISRLHHARNTGNAVGLVRKISRIVTAISGLGLTLLTTLSLSALTILFGTELASAWPALSILAFGLAASGLANMNLQVLGAIGKVGRRATIMNIAVGLNVVLNLALIYLYGYIGAAIATTITYVFLLGLSVRELNRNGFTTLELPMLWRLGIPALAAGGVALLVASVTPGALLTIILGGGAGAIVYGLIAIFVTKGVLIEDLEMLWNETRALLPKR